MQKNLLLFLAFILFAANLFCQTIRERTATKTGTLSTSQSSGSAQSGANGGCWVYISSSSKFLCIGTNDTLIATHNISDQNFQWYQGSLDNPLPGKTDTTLVVTGPGIYYFSDNDYTNDVNCNDGFVVTSIVPFDSVTRSMNNIFCEQGSVNLILTAPLPYHSFIASNYTWYQNDGLISGQNLNTYSPTTSGNYSVRFMGNNGCSLISDTFNVTTYPLPTTSIAIKAVNTITGSTFYDSIPQADSILILAHNILKRIHSCGTFYLSLDTTGFKSDLYPESVTWYYNNNSINDFNNHGIIVAGGKGAGNGPNQLNQPYGIFLDSMKNIYIADYNNERIMKWGPGSDIGNSILNSTQLGGNPTDVVFNSYYNSISACSISQTQNQSSSSTGSIIFSGPNYWGLSLDNSNNIYTSNDGYFNSGTLNSGEIDEWTPNNNFEGYISNSIGTDLTDINYPNGIFVDNSGDIYVADNLLDSADNYYGRIVEWTGTGGIYFLSPVLIAGGNGNSNAPNEISLAAGVTMDSLGNMYITDAINNRVQLWRPGADHGITIASGFTPWGIKVDDSDNVYVADQTNNQVLKFPPLYNSTITPLANGTYYAVITYPGGCTVQTNNFVVDNCSEVVLSVSLLNFTGQLKNNNAVLTWQTTSEVNSSYFEVQRSLDGINFITVGKVAASGNSSTLRNYLYYDNNVNTFNTSTIYYRLEEVDIDGKAVQSNIISISLERLGWSFSVSPNPVKSSLRIQMNNLYGNTTISLYDMTGRIINFQQLNASGNDVVNLNTYNLSAGLYTITILNNGQSKNIKFEKE